MDQLDNIRNRLAVKPGQAPDGLLEALERSITETTPSPSAAGSDVASGSRRRKFRIFGIAAASFAAAAAIALLIVSIKAPVNDNIQSTALSSAPSSAGGQHIAHTEIQPYDINDTDPDQAPETPVVHGLSQNRSGNAAPAPAPIRKQLQARTSSRRNIAQAPVSPKPMPVPLEDPDEVVNIEQANRATAMALEKLHSGLTHAQSHATESLNTLNKTIDDAANAVYQRL